MADEQNTNAQNDNATGTATGNTQAASVRTFTQADIDRIAGAAREEGRQAAARAADEARLKEQGEFKALYEKAQAELEALKPFKAQAESALQALKDTVQAEIAQLPEDVRGLVPEYDDPRKTLAWINANKARLVRPVAPGTDAGARGDVNSASTMNLTPEQRQAARTFKMSDAEYIQAVMNMKAAHKE